MDMNKYKFYQSGNKVYAVSTYAGKTVRGVAKCSNEDTFDLEKGKRLAAARCAVKVAQRRVARAEQKSYEAQNALTTAILHNADMHRYRSDANFACEAANDYLNDLLNTY